MAINPLLLNVKPISEITTVDNPTEGHLLFYDGSDELKKVDIIEFQSLIGGIAKPLAITDTSPNVVGWYKPTTSGTYANAGGLVAQEGYDTLFYFDGTTWSKVEVALPLPAYSTHFNHTSTDKAETGKSIADFLKKEINYTGIFKSKDMELESGFYIRQDTGNVEPYSSISATPFIPISILKRRLKLTYNTPYQAYQQFAFYDADKNFIPDGNSAAQNRDFIVPENASFVRFSVENAAKDSYIFNFYNEVDNTQRKRIVTVGAFGDFKTITDAVSILNDDFIIHLENGIYDEELKLHNKKITIIGSDRNRTIIRGTTGDYYHPGLEVSGEVYFENLTFEETSENQVGTPAMRAYAVHLDYAGAGIMEFNNCIFKGNAHNTLGIGLHNGQKLRFVNCEIHHYNTIGAGCMFAHNNPFPKNGVNQAMEVINCNFFLYGGVNILALNDAAWTWQDGHRVDNGTYFLFINNTFWSDSGTPIVHQDPLPFGAGKIAGNIKLHSASRGNSIAVLNY